MSNKTQLQTNNSKLNSLIESLSNRSVDSVKLQSKEVTPTTTIQNITPDSGYDGLSQVTVNAMPTTTQAIPSITVSTDGLITASVNQSAGYVTSGTESATKQLNAKSTATITPTTINQTIPAGTYCSGTQTIKGDSNLVPSNIKSGVSIFGVNGTYEGSGGGSSGMTIPQNNRVTISGFSSMGCIIKYNKYDELSNEIVFVDQENFNETITIEVLENSIIVLQDSGGNNFSVSSVKDESGYTSPDSLVVGHSYTEEPFKTIIIGTTPVVITVVYELSEPEIPM